MSRLAFVVVLGIFLAVGSAQADSKDAKAFVQQVSDRVLKIIRSPDKNSDAKQQELEEVFNSVVDSRWMGKFVLGRHYKSLSPDRQKKYLELYNQFLVNSYVPKFRDYTGEEFVVDNVVDKGKGEYTVQTQLVKKENAPAIRVDYYLRQDAAGYKIIDIIGEGISLITTERSDFGGMISKEGVDGFVDKLEARVKQQQAKK